MSGKVCMNLKEKSHSGKCSTIVPYPKKAIAIAIA